MAPSVIQYVSTTEHLPMTRIILHEGLHNNKVSLLGEEINKEWILGTGLWIDDFYIKFLPVLKHLWVFSLSFFLGLFWPKLSRVCHVFPFICTWISYLLDWLMMYIETFEDWFWSFVLFFYLITQDLGWTLRMIKPIQISFWIQSR